MKQLDFPMPIEELRRLTKLPFDYKAYESKAKRKLSLRRAIDEERLRASMIKGAKRDGIYNPKIPNSNKSDTPPVPIDQGRRELILRLAVMGVTSNEYQMASGQSGQRASHHLHTQKSAGLIAITGKTVSTTKVRTRGVNIYTITRAGLKMLAETYDV